MKNPSELKEIYKTAGVNPIEGKKNIFTCGSAITACIDALAYVAAFEEDG